MNKKRKKNIIKDYESEKDEQMIGCEPNSTPTYFHIMETVRKVLNEWGGYNRIPDISEIGEFVYSMDFDEDEYQEYLQDNELEDNDENKKTFIMDYVEFDFELLDSETYHSLGYYKLSYSDIENNFDEFGEPLACQVLNDCLKFGKGKIEKELLSSPSMNVDVNNPDSINMAAVKILPNGAYYKGCRGFILTNGVVVYTEAEHNHCMKIPGIKGTYDFVWKGNIRLIKDSINVWVKPTIEQKRTLLSVIRCYANEHLIISVCQNGEIKYKDFIHPNAEEIFNFLDRVYGVNECFSRIIREEIENTLQEPNKDLMQLSIDNYGLTNRLSLGGFILPNGGLLKFSDSNEVRDIDHRNIRGIYTSNNIDIPLDKQYRFSYVVDFMNHGAIRYDSKNGTISLTKEPTKQQYVVIQQIARVNMRNGLYVDIMNSQNGDVIYSFEYDIPMPLKVVKDIQKYFNGGIQQLNENSRASITYNGKYYDFSELPSIPFIMQNGKLIYGENEDTHEDAIIRYYLKMIGENPNNYINEYNMFKYDILSAKYTNLRNFIKNLLDENFSVIGRIFMIDGKYIIAFDSEISKDDLENVYYSLLKNNLIPNSPKIVYVNFGGKYHLITEYLKV